jgi:hypothetical protein
MVAAPLDIAEIQGADNPARRVSNRKRRTPPLARTIGRLKSGHESAATGLKM